jgi:hypothetical protein
MSDWVIRPAVRDDEPCIASMWLRQLCHGQDARAAGMRGASERGSDEQIAYWQELQPIVTALIRSAVVTVACDPERATHEPGAPAVVWGWAVTRDDVVFGAGIKRSVSRAGLGADLARDILGERLQRPQVTVLDLVDLASLRLIPPTWRRERGWLSSLRQLSQRVIADDALYQVVVRHVIDPTRERWVPSSKRAA